MKTNQDLLDIERRIRITERVREKWAADPVFNEAARAESLSVFDYLLRKLAERKAEIRAELGVLQPVVPTPHPSEPVERAVDGWEDFK